MIEKQERPDWLESFTKESTVNPSKIGYVQLPVAETEEPASVSDVYMAHLRQENTIGSLLNRKAPYQLSGESQSNYDFTTYVNMIPKNRLAQADKYFGATTEDEFNLITQQLDMEDRDKSVLAANPWKALAFALDPIEPANWLPGGAIYKEAKAASAVARSMMGVGIAAAASVGVSEAVLQQNELTRTMQESITNIVGAGLLGGAIGGGMSFMASRGLAKELDVETIKSHERILDDINDTLAPSDAMSAQRSAIMDGNELARMPKTIAKSMVLTPMNRLINSPFKTAKWFGSAAYEHGYELAKNGAGIATPSSLEQSIKLEMRQLDKLQIGHINNFYEMHGVTGKKFKATRKKLQELGSSESSININLDQFNRLVYESALTGVEHEIPQVNKSASLYRSHFDKIKNQAIEEGLLPEDVTVPNAINYIMIAYNKNKIIEEGGKAARGDGTFAQHVFDKFVESQQAIKQYRESPLYVEAQAQIKSLKDNAKRLPVEELERINAKIADIGKRVKALEGLKIRGSKEKAEIRSHEKAIQELEKEKKAAERSREIPAKEKERIASEIAKIEQDILDKAPKAAKTWDGELHRIIEGDGVQTTEELIWDQVGQTIDNILGDADGKLLNPFLSKLGGATKPFQARKLMIDQLEASPWHITDIQKIADMHNRAMIPTIQLQRFAKSQGYKDINDFLLGMESTLKAEYEEASKGLTGKAAQNMRKQRDNAFRDIKATVEMLQGVYGQGFNILNNKASEFFNNIMNWNYTRMLGHMTLSSLPDMARLVMKNPLMHVLAQGIGDLASDVKKISKNDVQSLGYAIATEQASLFKTYIEHHGLSTNPGPFTKALNSLTRNFGNLSLMNPWQDIIQNMAGHIAINKILDIVHRSVEGKKISQKESTLIARIGIGQEHFATIAKFTEGNISNGTRYADWTNWDIKDGLESNALRAFQGAVARSIEEITVNPRLGDKPLLLMQRGALGNFTNLFFQFKSYMFAATNRILYSGIQNRNDINTYLGIVAMMGMGMLGYVASSVSRGSKDQLDLSPANLITEGLDRSGVLGILGEVVNIGRKQFGLGEVSRYKSRDAFGSVLGPTGGSVNELRDLFAKMLPFSSAYSDITTKDAAILMKLMPLQNVFYIQSLNRKIFHEAAEGLGARRVDD